MAAQAKAAEEASVKAQETPAEAPAEEAEQPARMTMEDVRRAREASLRRLSNKEEEAPAVQEVPKEAPKEAETPKTEERPASLYDTTKLDVSAIVGLDKELQQTLNMVDELTEVSGSRNGGER